jgi:membrane-associated phospholipid phosphatase
MIKINPFNWFKPVEIALIAYILTISCLLIFFHVRLTGITYHILLYGLPTVVLMLLIFLQNRYPKNKYLILIRLFSPLPFLPILYGETDYFNNLFFAQNLDPFFANIEFLLFKAQPSLLFAEQMHFDWMAELMYFGYFSYYLLILLIPIYAFYTKGIHLAEKTIFIIINSFLLYYLIFIIIPVAGPQFYFSEKMTLLPEGYLFGPIIKLIQLHGEGETGAFPSSHVSICLIILYICYAEIKKLFPYVLIISILLILSTVYLRAHYVIDLLGALIMTPVMYIFSFWLYKKFEFTAYDKPSGRISRSKK